jgi:hypothetical protein
VEQETIRASCLLLVWLTRRSWRWRRCISETSVDFQRTTQPPLLEPLIQNNAYLYNFFACEDWLRSTCCLSVNLPQQLLNDWTDLYETWYVYHGTWALLNPSHRPVYICIPVSLLGNGSVKTLPRQRTHMQRKNSRTSFSMRSVSYQRNVDDYIFPQILVYYVAEEHMR